MFGFYQDKLYIYLLIKLKITNGLKMDPATCFTRHLPIISILFSGFKIMIICSLKYHHYHKQVVLIQRQLALQGTFGKCLETLSKLVSSSTEIEKLCHKPTFRFRGPVAAAVFCSSVCLLSNS